MRVKYHHYRIVTELGHQIGHTHNTEAEAREWLVNVTYPARLYIERVTSEPIFPPVGSAPTASIATVVEPDKATAEIPCPVCHGTGGGPDRALACVTCGGDGTLPVADLRTFSPTDDAPPELTKTVAGVPLDAQYVRPPDDVEADDRESSFERWSAAFEQGYQKGYDYAKKKAADSASVGDDVLEPIRDLLRYLGSFPQWRQEGERSMSYRTYREVWEAGRAALMKLEQAASRAGVDE